jgi:hypothetical protein
MNFHLSLPVVLLCASTAVAADDKIVWDKADGVLAKAAAVGKPVIWFFVVNKFDKNGVPPGVDQIDLADKAFQNPVIVKRQGPFLWVRGDQTLANSFKVTGAPGIVITDADGDVMHRATITTPEALYDSMQLVLKEKWVDEPVEWGNVVRTGPIKKKLLVIGFDNDSGDALKGLEDKTLVKYHKSCEFVKLPWTKGGDDAKKYAADKNPTIVICDAMERVLATVSGKLQPCQIKAAIQKAMAKLDARK